VGARRAAQSTEHGGGGLPLTRIGYEAPRVDEALALVRSEVVAHQSRGDWAFQALIDVAWRLRALRCLVPDLAGDPDVVACAQALVNTQDPETGGWRLAGRTGPVSVTATSAAVLALLGLQTEVDVVPIVRRGLGMLISSVVDDDERANRCPPPRFRYLSLWLAITRL
jgi:hypothetical protein